MSSRVSVAQAFELLKAIMERPGHRFWPMDITLSEAVQPFQNRLVGHRQVTDAYLLGLAIKNKGRLSLWIGELRFWRERAIGST